MQFHSWFRFHQILSNHIKLVCQTFTHIHTYTHTHTYSLHTHTRTHTYTHNFKVASFCSPQTSCGAAEKRQSRGSRDLQRSVNLFQRHCWVHQSLSGQYTHAGEIFINTSSKSSNNSNNNSN